MLYAILICSDPGCAEEVEAYPDEVDLDQLICECGCSVQAIAFGETEFAQIPATVQSLPRLPSQSPWRGDRAA
jgi:hypothetical protein